VMARLYTEEWLLAREKRLKKLYGGIKPMPDDAAVLPTEAPIPVKLSMTLGLPFPPTLNHNLTAWRSLTPAHQAFRADVEQRVKTWVHLNRAYGVLPLEGKLAINIVVWRGDRRQFDADNLIKPTLDALQKAGVCENDNQFHSICILKRERQASAGAMVTIWSTE